MTVDGDVDHGVEGTVEFGGAVGVERGGYPGEQRLARPTRDEHGVPESVPGFVGGVQAFELGRDVEGSGSSPVVPLLRVAHGRHRPGRRAEAGVGVDELDLLVLGHRMGDVAGDVEQQVGRLERAGGLEAVEEPRGALEECRERGAVEGRAFGGHPIDVTSRRRRG